MLKRALLLVAVAVLVALIPAYVLLTPDRGMPDDAPTESGMATEIGSAVMEHVFRGHVPGRSAEIMLVPRPHNFLIGEWDLTTLGADQPTTSTSHPNPWNYLTRVPIIFYRPGAIAKGAVVDDEVDIADIAPTFAEVLGMEGFESDGSALSVPEVGTLSRAIIAPRPKVIFTVVIDGGGWNALQEHPHSWPNIERLQRAGTTYVNATIGSAPSITGALHATFGSGFYPLHHGLPGNQMRDPDGKNVDTWLQNADPRYLEVPTVSELWDEQNGNRPIVASVSYEGWHLGMIGHGAQREGGDKDIAVLWEAMEDAWWVNEDYYELPSYLATTDLERLESYEDELDERDALADGTWFGHEIDLLQEPLARPSTPAFARFTGDAVVDVLRNEDIGKDGLTDFVWIEMKMPDYAGHAFNMTTPEEGDVILETDRQIGRFVRELDRLVGRGEYLFAVSADHGQQPFPDLHGGWRINLKELERDIEGRFGKVVEKISPVDIYLDLDALDESDYSAAEIARYIGTYTLGDNIPEGADGAERVPEGRHPELLFAGAFSTEYLQALTPEEIASFGAGTYPEGDFTIGDD